MSVVAPSVVRPDEPQYEVFMVERTDDRRFMMWQHSLNPNTNALSEKKPLHFVEGITYKAIDCWVQAGEPTDISVPEDVRKKKFTKLYRLVQNYARDIHVIWNNDPTTQVIRQYYVVDGSMGPRTWETECGPNAHSIRAVYLAPGMTPDDPDYAALSDPNGKPSGLKLLARSEEIHYVGCAGTPSITTWIDKVPYWIVGPGNQTQQHYSGIAIDPRYVWVFGNEPRCWFACATPGSIVKAAQGKGDPHWLRYDFDSQPPQTIRSLSPCADGTITLATENDLWMADYEVRPTPENFKITIHGNWVNKREASVDQIQRLPIPCWPLYNSLRHDLKKAVKPASAQ